MAILSENITKKLSEKVLESMGDFIPLYTAVFQTPIELLSPEIKEINIVGIYLFNAETLLGFWNDENKQIQLSVEIDGIKVNIHLLEINRYIDNLLLDNNAFWIEAIFSENILLEHDKFLEFKQHVQKYYITKQLHSHYKQKAEKYISELSNNSQIPLETCLNLFASMLVAVNIYKYNTLSLNIQDLNTNWYKNNLLSQLIEQFKNNESNVSPDDIQETLRQANLLLSELDILVENSSLLGNIRNRYKLGMLVAPLYKEILLAIASKIAFKPVKYDLTFIQKAQRKLLLESNPFAELEKELGQKIPPSKIVFIPALDNYFLIKHKRPRGQFYEFIDIERFILKLIKSNPYCIIALFAPNPINICAELQLLKDTSGIVLSKQVMESFSRHSNRLFDNYFKDEENQKNPGNLVMAAILLLLAQNILQTGLPQYDMQQHFQNFETLLTHGWKKEKIDAYFEELNKNLAETSNNAFSLSQEPDVPTLIKTLQEIKLKHWL